MINLHHFKKNVTSQHGEDGILKKIFEVIGSEKKRCVEFGAYSLKDCSNTFSLWHGDGWEALLIEGDSNKSEKIITDYESMCKSKHPPSGKVKVLNTFVEIKGVNCLDSILRQNGWSDQVDLCSIDIDGLDYQIFEAMESLPRVVVCEFNPTIPLGVSLVGNPSGNYLGCSATSLVELGVRKGYSLVACTKVNCIFVKNEYAKYFDNVNRLDLLFDNFAINYLMTNYDGSVFLSNEPYYHSNLFSNSIKYDLDKCQNTFWIPACNLKYKYIFTRIGFNLLNYLFPRIAELTRKIYRNNQ